MCAPISGKPIRSRPEYAANGILRRPLAWAFTLFMPGPLFPRVFDPRLLMRPPAMSAGAEPMRDRSLFINP